jgi:type IV pilus assembly protein PilB
MPLIDSELGKILVEQAYLSEEELTKYLAESQHRHVPLVTALSESGIITSDLVESAVAEHYGLSFLDIKVHNPTSDVVTTLPEDIARAYSILVVSRAGDETVIAVSDPSNSFVEEAVRLNLDQTVPMFPAKDEGMKLRAEAVKNAAPSPKAGMSLSGNKTAAATGDRKPFAGKLTFLYASRAAIEPFYKFYRKPLATRFQAIINQQHKVVPELITEIFNDAIELRASDIHMEPQETIVVVRFRVDGVMHEAGRIPKDYYEGVVNRIKIESNMQIDEHFQAQDGAIRFQPRSGGKIDMRVSIVPVVDGEKIVLRILSEYVRSLTLESLGFNAEYRRIIETAAHKPFGMLITCGPTGAGKSTTLYALLKMRNSPDVNISTIEDPVEYKLQGVNHIQVNTDTGLTFAKGLRALVRQDPNVILVGEIRDGETASIAVNAALTGHLLFSTIHANDSATAVPRLLEMGVEPFLLASTLEVVIGQRLIRHICQQCRFSYSIPLEQAHKLFPGADKYFVKKDDVRLYRGKGCEACGGTGFRGRIGIYELLVVTPEIQELITHRASSADLNKQGLKQGLKLLFDDGFEKVKAGMTTVEELMRVAAPPELLFAR